MKKMISWQAKPFKSLSLDEFYILLEARIDVFVVEQACAYQELDHVDKHPCTKHLFAIEDGQLIAYARCYEKSSEIAAIGRVLVTKAFRGKGVADALLEQCLEYCLETWPHHKLQLSAQTHLQKFYASKGFIEISEPYLEDGIEHIDMEYRA